MRQRDPLAERGIQNRFAMFDLELDADRLETDLMCFLMSFLSFCHA